MKGHIYFRNNASFKDPESEGITCILLDDEKCIIAQKKIKVFDTSTYTVLKELSCPYFIDKVTTLKKNQNLLLAGTNTGMILAWSACSFDFLFFIEVDNLPSILSMCFSQDKLAIGTVVSCLFILF